MKKIKYDFKYITIRKNAEQIMKSKAGYYNTLVNERNDELTFLEYKEGWIEETLIEC
jgi:hypothetical protein